MTALITIGGIACNSGEPDDEGVLWTCADLPGWIGSPSGTLAVAQRSQDHGGWGGGSWLKPRVIAATGTLVAPDYATAVRAIDRLSEAASLDSATLVVAEGDLERQCTVRRDDDVLPAWQGDTTVTWSVQLIATDPRRYATAEITASTGLPSTVGGLTWPVTWAPTSSPLNANSTMESGISPWSGAGDTLASSGTQHHSGSLALRCTPDGVDAGIQISSEEIAVTPGALYSASAWLWSTASFPWEIGLSWYTSGHALISQSLLPYSLPASAWAFTSYADVAPPGAAFARLCVQAVGTPAASNLLYMDEAVMASVTGGLTWPADVTSGVLGIDLSGNIPTRPRLIVSGPCSNPQITLVGTDLVLAWALDLDAGQYLDVDTDRRTSLLNGQVSRSGAMTSRDWFELQPGHSDIAFAAAGYDPDATLTVMCRSAWQ